MEKQTKQKAIKDAVDKCPYKKECIREEISKLLFELVEYKELMGSLYLQSQIDKRKEIEEWMNKVGRHPDENFNKAIIAHFIDKHKEVNMEMEAW